MRPHPIHDDRYQNAVARLKQLREQRGLHQQAVAERLGRTQTYVSRYESGGRRLDLIELLDVLVALGADPHEFIDRVLEQPLKALPRGQ
ncbi:helix-turn-helix domain-containing protein [Paraburkholderia xenovorans]|uniref:Transcriptional regulator, XRE family n=1 Tax=Paraburkholderia xenovorans (strain LB400) TaxID=266265 RepID=Q13ZD0_PARXL|nr:helix-turn-helix transcriptional regulator [Paraburkholderia xenovorans]ABE30559.1 transcriptional regulator, XRE family [Paraburkholderia xenovorans LB400]